MLSAMSSSAKPATRRGWACAIVPSAGRCRRTAATNSSDVASKETAIVAVASAASHGASAERTLTLPWEWNTSQPPLNGRTARSSVLQVDSISMPRSLW